MPRIRSCKRWATKLSRFISLAHACPRIRFRPCHAAPDHKRGSVSLISPPWMVPTKCIFGNPLVDLTIDPALLPEKTFA